MISPVDARLPCFDAGKVGFLGPDARVRSQTSARRNQRVTLQGEAKSRREGRQFIWIIVQPQHAAAIDGRIMHLRPRVSSDIS